MEEAIILKVIKRGMYVMVKETNLLTMALWLVAVACRRRAEGVTTPAIYIGKASNQRVK